MPIGNWIREISYPLVILIGVAILWAAAYSDAMAQRLDGLSRPARIALPHAETPYDADDALGQLDAR